MGRQLQDDAFMAFFFYSTQALCGAAVFIPEASVETVLVVGAIGFCIYLYWRGRRTKASEEFLGVTGGLLLGYGVKLILIISG